MLSAPDSEAQPGGNGARLEQADAPPLVENHTQLGVENEGEITGRGNRAADGVHGGDAVRESSGRTEFSGVAARNLEAEGVNETQAEPERDSFSVADTRRSMVAPDADLQPDDGRTIGDKLDTADRLTGRQAKIQDRLPAPAFDSVNFPVQDAESLPVENKALPAQPVQVIASLSPVACPPLTSWRQVEGIWLPRYFTPVPHLKYELVVMSEDFKPVIEKRTGLQIQWNTTCPACQKRFRPVAGFITILHLERMREMNDDEQQNFIADIIRKRFDAGVSNQHPKCVSGD